jgi:Beta-lactamase enzyme family
MDCATLAAAAVLAAGGGCNERPAHRTSPPPLTTIARVREAERFARGRKGSIAFATLDEHGRLLGMNRTVRYPSASVVKAMLLVAVLRKGEPSAATRALLGPMITASDNKAALRVYREQVGDAGLYSVAHAAGMRNFFVRGAVFEAQLTAEDQARLFLKIDRLVPASRRAYARSLLSGIIAPQRWGIAPVASRRGYRIFFKGGWREGIVHQVALLERGGQRISLAILTSGEPSMAYGEATLAGIAARVLAP